LITVGRLLELISGDTVPIELKVESVVILGSLAKGPEHVVHSVFDSGIVPMLLKGTVAPSMKHLKYIDMFAIYFFLELNKEFRERERD